MDVPIQRGRLDIEPLGDSAHRQLVESDFVQQRKRCVHHLCLIKHLTLSAPLMSPKRNPAHGASLSDQHPRSSRLTCQRGLHCANIVLILQSWLATNSPEDL